MYFTPATETAPAMAAIATTAPIDCDVAIANPSARPAMASTPSLVSATRERTYSGVRRLRHDPGVCSVIG